MQSVFGLASGYVQALTRLDPCDAVEKGMVACPAALSDYSPEGYASRAELARQYVRALATCSAESDTERVVAGLMRRRLSVELELYDAGLRQAQLDFVDAPIEQLLRVLEAVASSSASSGEQLADLLDEVPQALAGYRDSLRGAAAGGEVAARRQVSACADRCAKAERRLRRLADGSGSPSSREQMATAVGRAVEAYVAFARFLRQELAPLARADDARGRDRYLLWARSYLGGPLDPKAVYGWACEEFHRLRSEFRHLAFRVTGCRDLGEAIARLDADPDGHIAPGPPTRQWMADRLERAFDVIEPHIDIPAPLRQLECHLADTGGIYYRRPSSDLQRPGRVVFGLGPDEPFIVWRGTTTLFHEGVPGHHLQLGCTTWLGDQLDDFRRHACHVPGHVEGWALYAEQLMDELGGFETDRERLGMLDAHLLRTARVIVDIGMHLELRIPSGFGFHEGEIWNPHLAHDLLAHHLVNPWAKFVDYEIDRYLGRPGQATTYKLGLQAWLDARASYTSDPERPKDLKTFHHQALNLGCVDLTTVQEMATLRHPPGYEPSPEA